MACRSRCSECVGRTFAARYGLETLFIRAHMDCFARREMEQLARDGGGRPVEFGLFHYIDVRDLAEACLRTLDCPLDWLAGNLRRCWRDEHIGASLFALSEACPIDCRKRLQADGSILRQSPIELAKTLLGWTPQRSWRAL